MRIKFSLPLCALSALGLFLGSAGLLSTAHAAKTRQSAPATQPATKPTNYVYELGAKLEPAPVLVYKKVGDRELHLHVFEPAGHKPTDRLPCFVTIHGGGWVNGEPRENYAFAQWAVDHGMLGISIEYRLLKPGTDVTPFDCVKDGRSALRYVRGHSGELGIDPQRIVASGASAGGHVAAATGMFDGIDEAGEDTSISCVPNAMVLHFPVIDTSPQGYGNAKCGPRWKEISPVDCVRPGLPPTIIFHGTADTTCPFKGAQSFYDAMIKAKNRCELVSHDGGSHGYLMRDKALYEEAMQKAETFLKSLGYIK